MSRQKQHSYITGIVPFLLLYLGPRTRLLLEIKRSQSTQIFKSRLNSFLFHDYHDTIIIILTCQKYHLLLFIGLLSDDIFSKSVVKHFGIWNIDVSPLSLDPGSIYPYCQKLLFLDFLVLVFRPLFYH